MKERKVVKRRKYYLFQNPFHFDKDAVLCEGPCVKQLVRRYFVNREKLSGNELDYLTIHKEEDTYTFMGMSFDLYRCGYSYGNSSGTAPVFVHEIVDNLKDIVRYPHDD